MGSIDIVRVLSISACLVVGCLTRARTQLYDGPALPRHAIAQIREDVAAQTRIESIDGVEVHGSQWDVLPGEHDLVASARLANMMYDGEDHVRVYVRVNCQIRFTALAGRTYFATRSGKFERVGVSRHEYELAAYVVDAELRDEPLGSYECVDEDFGIMGYRRIGPSAIASVREAAID